MEKFSFFGPFFRQVNATITKSPKKFDKKKLPRITENFQISLGITYWFTYIHSFKLQSNDKNTWFCQHFLNIFSKFCQYSFFRGKIFQSFFSAEGDKKLRTNFAGFARQKAKNSSFPWFSEKKSSSPPGTPTGSGFRQSCSKIFR